MHTVTNSLEMYVRSFVRFEDLSDTNDTNFFVLRIATDTGSWLVAAGVLNLSANYYWYIRHNIGVGAKRAHFSRKLFTSVAR